MHSVDLESYAAAGLEAVRCNLCGADDAEPIARGERFGTAACTVICRRCGLMYLNPRWTAEAYARFYASDYRALMGQSEEPLREVLLRQRVHGARILAFCGEYLRPGARVLDIGCGVGGVLDALRRARGCAGVGVEPCAEHARYARRIGLDVREGRFEDIAWANERFDLVILTQTLNHLLDPAGTLARIRRVLAPEGKLFLEVQNVPEYARMCPTPFQVDHTYYFCPETLECMVRRAGFEPLNVEVETAGRAALVHRYMWHRSAAIHVRMLVEASVPEPEVPWPDYRVIRDEVKGALARWNQQSRAPLAAASA